MQNIRRRLSPELPKNLEQAELLGIPLEEVNRYLQGREIPQLLDGIQQAGARAAKKSSPTCSVSVVAVPGKWRLATCPR
nr:hypothetical protein GCM10020185_52320 [Pseudomonas brassicacearum subsp. brassicacearum]